ncbi:hypothetical protein EON82_14690 [bacterium]|nr:MAG: hypothetical protein EON82_14690 [bacterium]
MSERMRWSEAEAVVRAYRAEHGMTHDVDVATLARALGTDVAEVRRLAGRKPRFVDRSGLLSAGLAMAAAALVFALTGPGIVAKNPIVASLLPAQQTPVYMAPIEVPRVPAVAKRRVFIQDKHGWTIETEPPVDM